MTQLAPLKQLVLTFAAALLTPQFASAQMLTEEDKGLDFPPLTQSSLISINETLSPENKICQDYKSAMMTHALPGGKTAKLSDNPKYQRTEIYTSYWRTADPKDKTFPEDLKIQQTQIGTFMQAGDGPIFYYFSHYGSWRGNSGVVYASNSYAWDVLPWESFDEHEGDLSTQKRPPSLPEGFSLLQEAFVGPNFEVYWNANSDVVLRYIPKSVTAAWRSDFQPLYKVSTQDDTLKLAFLCMPKMDWSGVNQSTFPNLSTFLQTLRLIGGEPVFSGTLGSSRRQVNFAAGVRSAAFITPWTIGESYNTSETTAIALENWSYQDAWSRWKYLNLIETYEPALEDIYWLLANHYGSVPENIDALAQQTLDRIIRNHFIFRKDTRADPYIYSKFDPRLIDAFNQNMDSETFDAALAAAQALDAETDSSSNVHRLITASFYSPNLINHVMTSGDALEAKNRFGKTPLMVAAHIGNPTAVRRLIAANVDISAELTPAPSKYGFSEALKPEPRSALDYAIENAPMEIIDMLLNAGAETATPEMLEQRIELNPNFDWVERETLIIRLGGSVE